MLEPLHHLLVHENFHKNNPTSINEYGAARPLNFFVILLAQNQLELDAWQHALEWSEVRFWPR